MTLQIRPVTEADWPALWAMLEPVLRAGETYAIDRDIGEAKARDYWCSLERQTFVAEDDGQPLGTYYLVANFGGGASHVCNCGYVTAEAARGRGVARAMLRHSLGAAREAGFAAMQFNCVVVTNAGAIALWQSEGFETVGRLPGVFRHPTAGEVDALVMYRRL